MAARAITHIQMGKALEAFSQAHPDVALLIHFGELTDPSGGIRSGHADAAVVHGPFESRDLELAYLWSDPLVVAMGAGHPLAAKDELTIAEVVGEPTFDFPTPDREWRDFWMLTAHRGGRPPRIVAHFSSLDAMIEAVRAGLGIHVTTAELIDGLGPGSGIVLVARARPGGARALAGLRAAATSASWCASSPPPAWRLSRRLARSR